MSDRTDRDPLFVAGIVGAGLGVLLVVLTYVVFQGDPKTLFLGLLLVPVGGIVALVGLMRTR
jgi:hypothetical protein